MAKYFLTEEREVTKAEFVRAERNAGFHNSMGQSEEPATAGFSKSFSFGGHFFTISGRVMETDMEEVKDG